jgi:predicted PurR-regulated permease PerM
MTAPLPEEPPPIPSLEARLSAGEQWERYGRYPYLLSKLLFFGVLFAGSIWLLDTVSAVAFPLFLSLLLAYLLDPTIDRLESRGISRTVSILIFLSVGLAFITIFALFLYPTLATQVGKVMERLPRLWTTIQFEFVPWVEQTFNVEVPPTLSEAFDRYGEGIREALPALAQRAGAWGSALATQTGAVVVSILNLVMIPVFTFYFLRDFDRGRLSLVKYFPPYRKEFLLERIKLMDVVVGQWFRGQLQVSGILAVLYAIGLGLVYGLSGLDIQSGVVIGLLTGILNVIPYFGFAVGSLLAILVVLIDWGGWWPVFGVLACFTIIQLLESYLITPRVVGDKVGLQPVTVIIVLLVGGHVAGLLGVLLAIPVTGAVKVLIPDIVRWYQRSSVFTGRPELPAVLCVQTEGSQGERPLQGLRDQGTGEDGEAGHSEPGELKDVTSQADAPPSREASPARTGEGDTAAASKDDPGRGPSSSEGKDPTPESV